jgi:hypothetical protein
VGNSPRLVLSGGATRKMAHNGETSTSNSGDSASLLHGSFGFVSRSYNGGTAPSCSASSQRGSGGAIAVRWWRWAKAAAQFLQPKTIIGREFI